MGITNMKTEERFIRAKRALFDKLYDSLNDRQREAVFSVNGPLLVLAGAGTGKTTVLVNRIAYLIRYGNAYFSERIPSGMNDAEAERLEAERREVEEIARRKAEESPVWKTSGLPCSL